MTLRLVWRRAAARPGATLLAVATLAIGIGATAALFTVVNAVLLQPLPFPAADRLVTLRHAAPGLAQLPDLPMSDALYFFYAAESRTLDGVALYRAAPASFTGPDDPQRVPAAQVTASFFDVVRTPPRLGRAFTAADERRDAAPVAVLSDGLWRARFGADPDAVGRLVDLDGARTEVIGVMPPAFLGPWQPDPALWRPLRLDPADVQLGGFGYAGLARLAPGSAPAAAQAELETFTANLTVHFADDGAAPILARAGFRPLVDPARDAVVGDIAPTLWLLLGAAGLLLAMACANVAALSLVRSEARGGETAVRAALGESRARRAGAVLIEHLALGGAAGAAAAPLALLAVRLLVRFGPRDLPRLQEIAVDGTVLGVGAGVAAAAGLLCGAAPAWRAAARDAARRVTDGARGTAGGRRRTHVRRGLVTAQIALASTLIVGAGLTVRSFQRLAAVDPGFDPADALAFGLALPARDYPTPAARLAFHRRLIARLRALPGAAGAAAASTLPLSGVLQGSGHTVEGRPLVDGAAPPVLFWARVSPGYFDAMGIAVVEGRVFERLDGERGDPVVLVSQAAARALWPDGAAIGRGIRPGGPPEEDDEAWFRVVGVVDDVHQTTLHDDPPQMAYYPLPGLVVGEDVPTAMRYVVRAPDPAALTGAVRTAVRALDPTLPLADVETLAAVVARARAERAFVMALLLLAAGIAAALGAVGLYGVVSALVAQRTREIAIRMAVGAQPADVRRLVVREAAGMAGVGAALGVAGAAAAARQLDARLAETLLFDTSPLDPVAFAAAPLLLAGICLAASRAPARRAAAVDPMLALRAE